jgi:hypothetical protein
MWRLKAIECGGDEAEDELPELLLQFESGGTGSRYEGDDGDGRSIAWRRQDEQLRFDEIAHDYCVEDGELRLSVPEGPTYLLERVYGRQRTIPTCEERDADECEVGEQPDEGCQLGICTGSAWCDDIAAESSCTNQEGCEWDDDVCRGEPVASCRLWHYGKMPGCELSDETPTCAGSSRQCRDLSLLDCERNAACAVEPGCIGSTIPCSMVSTCDAIAGCGRDDRGVCTGVSECSEQTTAEQCGAAARGAATSGCQWVDVCAGDASLPCEELSLSGCDAVPGCQLEFPED